MHRNGSRNGRATPSALVAAEYVEATPVTVSPELVYGQDPRSLPIRARLQQQRAEQRLVARRRLAETGVRQLARLTDTAHLEVALSLDAGRHVRAAFAENLGPRGEAALDALEQLFLRGVVQVAVDTQARIAGDITEFEPAGAAVGGLEVVLTWLKEH